MCLIGFVWRPGTAEPLRVAANRDEFHERPSAPAERWGEAPDVFGGRDLKEGGSWLAVSTRRRFAAVTNVRRMIPPNPAAPSRGSLVADFIRGSESAGTFAERLRDRAPRFSGFNLLLYDGREMLYVDNHPEFEIAPIAPGAHVVSNDQLDTPWPKSRRLQGVLERDADAEALLLALADPVPARDDELPDTGVGRELERMLSPPFIVGDAYGTRCSTLVFFEADRIRFIERRFGPGGIEVGRTERQLPLDAGA